MPIPADITIITVTGTYIKSDGSPCKGSVRFTPSINVSTPGTLLPAVVVSERLDSGGSFSATLVATDDPDWDAPGWHYQVEERITGRDVREYNIVVPIDTPDGELDLSTVAPAVDPDEVTPYILTTQKGAAFGVAPLDGDSQIPVDYLANASGGGGGGTPSSTVVSETGYGQSATAGDASTYSRGNHTHGSPALGTSGTTAAAGNHNHTGVYQPLDADLTAIAALTATTDNVVQSVGSAWASRSPSQLKTTLALVKADVGLGNADNTSDASKPISTATQTALDGLGTEIDDLTSATSGALAGKQPLDSDLTTIAGLTATTDNVIQSAGSAWSSRTPAQLKTTLALVKGDVGLSNVDNTSDTGKPVSTAQQAALDLKADLASPALTGNPTAPTQASGNNSTRIATTAYVQTEVGLLAGGGGTDYKTGSRPVSGKWYRGPAFGPVGANTTATLNRLFFVVFRLASATTFDRIGIDVATAAGAGGVARLGIFASDAAGDLPGTLILDAGTVAIDTTGGKTITISQALNAGVYWLAVVNQTTGTAALRGVTTYDPLIPYYTGASMFTGSTAPGGIFASGVTGALASNPTIVDNDNGPIIGLRAS